MRFVRFTLTGLLFLFTACGGGGAGLTSVSSLQIEPATVRVAKGVTQTFTARAIFTDGSSRDVTPLVNWNIRQTAGAIAVRGVAGNQIVGGETGSSSVEGTFDGVTAQSAVTVIPATLKRVEVTPARNTIAPLTTLQFAATAIYTDESTIDVTTSALWAASSTKASVDSTTGLVTGVSATTSDQPVNIQATFEGVMGSTPLFVSGATLSSISITPAASSTPLGVNVQFTATGNFSDATTQDITSSVVWASSDTSVATISTAAATRGLVTPVALGTTTISATFYGVSGSTSFTVNAASLSSIAVTRVSASVAKGLTDQFTATGTYSNSTTQDITNSVTWTTSNNLVATVSNAGGTQGLATSTGTGTATITATLSGVTGNNTITVTAAELVSIALSSTYTTVIKNLTEQLVATGTYTDSSTQVITTAVTYTSSNTGVATVSNAGGSNGLVTGAANGAFSITATEPTSGVVSGAYSMSVATLTSIAVTPANPTVTISGGPQQMVATATLTYADTSTTTRVITTLATWTSANECFFTVGTVSPNIGKVTGVAAGSANVTATLAGVSGSTLITITP